MYTPWHDRALLKLVKAWPCAIETGPCFASDADLPDDVIRQIIPRAYVARWVLLGTRFRYRRIDRSSSATVFHHGILWVCLANPNKQRNRWRASLSGSRLSSFRFLQRCGSRSSEFSRFRLLRPLLPPPQRPPGSSSGKLLPTRQPGRP